MKMEEKKSTTKKLSKNDSNNNETNAKKDRKQIVHTAEMFGNATLLPTTISYSSNILPDAIFLTTSSGQLITTSSVNPTTLQHQQPTTSFLSEPSAEETTTPCDRMKIDNKNNTKKEKTEAITLQHGAAASDETPKPSALETTNTEKSSASTTTTTTTSSRIQQPPAKSIVVSTPSITTQNTKQQIGTFTTNFPILASGLTATNLTGFTTAQANLATFSLPNSFLGTGLTIPLYNSFVAVSTTTKDGVLPILAKDLFPAGQTPRTKGSGNKSKNNFSQNGNGMTTTRGRKRTAQSRLPAKLKEPAAVARRNARERRRVKMVNDGFLRLRRHVPTDPKNKKLSKVKTLRLAIEYIHHLQQLLQSDSSKQTASSIVSSFTQVANSYDDLESPNGNGWLHSESLVSFVLFHFIFSMTDLATATSCGKSFA